MKKYSLYLFDFDGTLFDTYEALKLIFKVAYKAVGFDFDENKTLKYAREPLIIGYQENGCPMDQWDYFIKKIDEAIDLQEVLDLTVPYDDALSLFSFLKKNNISAGIVTNNNSKHIREILVNQHIDLSLFPIIVGNKECQTPKPNPDPILYALNKAKELNIDIADVVYVGDSLNDAKSAYNAHIDAILLDREGVYPKSDKYQIIRSLKELFYE